MIQANELRIGNWVNFMEDDTHFQVTEISPSGIGVKNNEEETWIELDQFSGIMLTPEILEKCGFEINKYACFIHTTKKMYLAMQKNTNMVSVNIESHFDGEVEELSEDLNITSLHQLQNLYFALTGTELNRTP